MSQTITYNDRDIPRHITANSDVGSNQLGPFYVSMNYLGNIHGYTYKSDPVAPYMRVR